MIACRGGLLRDREDHGDEDRGQHHLGRERVELLGDRSPRSGPGWFTAAAMTVDRS